MTRIPDEFIGPVFFLYPSRHDADVGNALGGTGFFAGANWGKNPNRFHVYAVTNKHNIIACRNNRVVIRATTIHGDLEFIESDRVDWHLSDAHDLGVLSISPKKALLFRSVSGHRFVTRDNFEDDPAGPTCLGPGDEVFMVGEECSMNSA
jgi:hypothetical protein